MQELDETAIRILDAASRRFLHYGYNKTTMSEIAGDCNMSTGNVYRFFPSKLDIADVFVRRLRRAHIEILLKIVTEPKASAKKKLKKLLKKKFRLAYERFHQRPKAFELSQVIMADRPEFAHEWEALERELVKEVLVAGNADGSFRIADPEKTAKTVQNAVFRFSSPSVFHEGDENSLATELDGVIELILDAFARQTDRTAGSEDPEDKDGGDVALRQHAEDVEKNNER